MSGSASLQSAGVYMVHMACLTHQWYVLVLTTLVLNAPDAGGALFQAHFSASAASALVFLIFWRFSFNCAVQLAFLLFSSSNSANKAIIFCSSLVGTLYFPSLTRILCLREPYAWAQA